MSIETLFSSNIIVPIIVAFISFLIAVTTAVIAKEQKVSEFRQAWIDNFRNEISEFISLSYNAILKTRISEINDKEKLTGELITDIHIHLSIYIAIEKSALLMKLRLNKKEHNEIISKIDLFVKGNNRRQDESLGQRFASLQTIENLAHDILKKEWERVKKGEKRYILFVSVGEFIGAIITVTYFVLLFLNKFPEYFPGIN
jgi:hypothetical protein